MGLFAIWNDPKAHVHKLISTKILTQFLPVGYSVWLPTSYVAITATGDFPFWGEKLIAPLLAYTKLGRNFLVYIAALAKEQIHSTINWYTVHFCTKWTLYLVLIMLWGLKCKILGSQKFWLCHTPWWHAQLSCVINSWYFIPNRRHTTANFRYQTGTGLC